MKIKVEDFKLCNAALAFIAELKQKNEKCDGKLNSTSKKILVLDGKTGKKKEELEYTWHVTYNADLLKVEKKI